MHTQLYILLLLLQSSSIEGRKIINSIRNSPESHTSDHLHKHPRVRSMECTTSVNRLKFGPANVPEVIHNQVRYTDVGFSGNTALYGVDTTYDSSSFKYQIENYMASGYYYWSRWEESYPIPTNNVVTGGNMNFLDPVQGGIGDCYVIASAASLAERNDIKPRILT